MFAANAYVIRPATERDHRIVKRLSQLDSKPELGGRVLIGELHGEPAAAISIEDGRVAADPFQHTARLAATLRMRRNSLRALDRNPSLVARLRAGVHVRRPASA